MKKIKIFEKEGKYVRDRIFSVKRQLEREDYLEIIDKFERVEEKDNVELFCTRCRKINLSYRLSRYQRYFSYFLATISTLYLIYYLIFL